MAGKVKYSNFHVTVNYNVDGEDHIEAMRSAVESMPEYPYLWQWLRQFDGSSQLEFDDDNKELVESVRLRAAFEHGGQQNHGLHVHIVIEVAHTTMVQISKDGIIAVFEEFLHGRRPNVHCRFVKGVGEDKDFILHYITKEVPRYAPKSAGNGRLKDAFDKADEIIEQDNEAP